MRSNSRPWTALRNVGVLLLLPSLACSLLVTYDPIPGESAPGGAGSGAAGPGGSGGVGPCGDNLYAPALSPADAATWHGPVAIRVSADDTLPVCSDGGTDLFADPVGDAAECSCDCQPNLSACEASLFPWDVANCANMTIGSVDIVQGCNTFSGTNDGVASMQWGLFAQRNSKCSGSVALENTLSPIAWTTHVRLCEVFRTSDGCAERPQGYEQRVCVFTIGDETCPAGYDDKAQYFLGMVDTRDCPETCSCDGSALSCAGTLTRHNNQNCSDTGQPMSLTECVLQGTVQAVRYTHAFSGSCQADAANPPAPIGGVTGDAPHTVCCTP